MFTLRKERVGWEKQSFTFLNEFTSNYNLIQKQSILYNIISYQTTPVSLLLITMTFEALQQCRIGTHRKRLFLQSSRPVRLYETPIESVIMHHFIQMEGDAVPLRHRPTIHTSRSRLEVGFPGVRYFGCLSCIKMIVGIIPDNACVNGSIFCATDMWHRQYPVI